MFLLPTFFQNAQHQCLFHWFNFTLCFEVYDPHIGSKTKPLFFLEFHSLVPTKVLRKLTVVWTKQPIVNDA